MAWTSRAAVSLVVAAGVLAAPAAAVAPADGWQPAVPVTRVGADVWDLDVALRDGRGIATWVAWTGDRTRLMTARQRRDGTWRPPQRVAGTGQVVEVELAADAGGRPQLVWTVGRRVLAARLHRDGTTSRPERLHRTPGGPLGTRPAYLRLAVDAGGAAAVAWETMDDDEAPPYAAPSAQVVVRDATVEWGEARTLSAADVDGIRPEVFVDRDGRATAVWGERSAGSWSVRAASRAPGGEWSASEPLSAPGERAGVPHLAGLASGRLAVAYAARSGSRRGLAVRQWSASAGWSAAALVRGARLPSWVDAGLSRQGPVVAFTDRRDAVWTASVAPDGEVSRTRLVPRVTVYYGLHLVVSPAGDAVVAWDSVRGDLHPVQGAYRARDGEWGRVTRLSGPGIDGFLGAPAITPGGRALVVWNGGVETDPDSSKVWASSHPGR